MCTTARELFHQIENIESGNGNREMTDEEFEQISRLQDQISGIEHPGYEMKEIYEDGDLVFYVFSKEDGIPVDSLKVSKQGNRYYMHGYWRSHAKTYALIEQIFRKWF